MEDYKKFQFGWVISIIFGITIAFLFYAYLNKLGNHPISFNGFVILTLFMTFILIQFYGITVIVNDKQLILKLGIGFYQKKIDLFSIKSVEIVRNSAMTGYGIRIIPNGVLYNVSGRDAVEIRFKDKKDVVQIGSDDCENLKFVLDNKIRKYNN